MAVGSNLRPKRIHMELFHNKDIRKTALGLFFFIALATLIYISILPQRYDIKVGDVAQEDIRARKDAINTVATRKLRQAAADSVSKKYILDHSITQEAKNEITQIFAGIKQVRSKDYLDEQGKIDALKHIVNKNLAEETYLQAIKADNSSLMEVETITKAILEKVMESGVKEDSIDRAKTYIIEEFKNVKLSQELKNMGEDIAFSVIKPNMVYDREATEKEQQEAMDSVEPVKIAKNQILIEKGTTVTAEQIELLKELGLLAQDKGSNLNLLAGTIFLAALLEGILVFAIYFFHKKLFGNELLLSLLALIILSNLIISIAVKTISNYLIPLAAGSMLISILINPSIALVSSFIMSIAVGVVMGNDFVVSTVAFLGAVVGVFCTVRLSQRVDLTKAGGIIGIVDFVLIMGMELLNNDPLWMAIKQSSWGIVSGLFSSVLTIGTLPFLESAFDITTSMKLLELSNPNQPLLKKLMIDAPGTYHHSIIVGNLAEAAAEAVGADPLLARVGANYHDIGKLKRPYFFIENQLTSDNPHDKLNPTLSALIITSHVKDGIEIAKEYRLPEVIKDFISQHHGTTLLSYFYNKAASGDRKPDEDGFRYEGPKPQTREVAIVMLADSAEAAVRSMSSPTPGKIEGLIRQIIKEKLADGQLDESDLTLKELDKIAAAFSRVLAGIFHTRIEYPDRLKELEGKQAKNA
ncbi:MAG: cyclic-di-AMP phosphodiesterase PgpH [Tepidanaerobacteraceae bacterium]|nr:cyclic-di-AMP phosphodiesterase PgpH [Tepidanaerobacteraceae bacterium]